MHFYHQMSSTGRITKVGDDVRNIAKSSDCIHPIVGSFHALNGSHFHAINELYICVKCSGIVLQVL